MSLEAALGYALARAQDKKNTPVADNCEVVLNALVVDICIRLEEGHGDLGGTDGLSGGGHARGQPLERPLGRSRL